jgi:acyl-CoA thioester hydrolase
VAGHPFVVHEYVRWGDVDPAGIIRWDAYTRFYELAESELFRSVGIPYSAIFRRFGIGLPRRVMHIEFLSPPVLDECLEVRAYVSAVGTTSLTLNFDVYGEGGVLRSTGYLVLVCVASGEGGVRKQPWPREFLDLIAPYCMTVEQARGSVPPREAGQRW